MNSDCSKQNNKEYRFGWLYAKTWGSHPHQQKLKHHPFEDPISFSKTVYHYTTLPGFCGIVESQGIWMSSIRYMNDSEEIVHGRKFATEIINAMLKKHKYKYFFHILEGVRDKLAIKSNDDLYLACFSLVGDSLDQWRGYCPKGGVSIEFSLKEYNPFFRYPSFFLQKVIYKPTHKAKSIILTIKRFFSEYMLDKRYYDHEYFDNSYFETYKATCSDDYIDNLNKQLEFKFTQFKDEAFQNEDEVRIITDKSQIERFTKLRFRPSNYAIIPYLCTNEYTPPEKYSHGKKGKLPISSVTISPSPYQDLTLTSIKQYLDSHGYDDTTVKLSSIPYRSF